ncbi:MAG: ATP-binding protein [Nitrospirae bacterium]|nr:ATP-binding protein [Nitrospirota bacterium]
MNNTIFSEHRKLRIEDWIVKQMSLGTIRSFPDAIVELVTNCDDSYKRLEEEKISCHGEIKISILRLKGGICKELVAIDFAEGMDRNQLEKALSFGGETSGFERGKSVRGLFGRGLKETIIALGKGTIYTIRDNKLSIAELWWDETERSAKYKITTESYVPSPEARRKIGIQENGTHVKIFVTNPKIKCPDYKTIKSQLCNHFALRDISSSSNRKVQLVFESPEKAELKQTTSILYEKPEGEEILTKSVTLPNFGDEVRIKVFESDSELESPYNNPFFISCLLIKSRGAILDNQLFKFSTEKAGWYFFGEVICDGIYEKVRQGDYGLIDPNRGGIEWKHQDCQILQNEIEKILQPFIEKKREELSKGKPQVKVSEKTKKMLQRICQLLNKFAKLELEKEPIIEDIGDEEIKDIMIKPPKANIEVDKERWFSVYIPLKQIGITPNVRRQFNEEVQHLGLRRSYPKCLWRDDISNLIWKRGTG